MDRIWAPWRKQYVSKDKGGTCIFCEKPKERDDKKNYIISRRKFSFSVLNIFPYNNGHMMVAPYRHIKDLNGLSHEETMELMDLLKESCRLLDEALAPTGYNIGINMGKAAGAGYPEHIHIHIVPRWAGDTNFMPATSGTKVIPESLDALYERLIKYAEEKKD